MVSLHPKPFVFALACIVSAATGASTCAADGVQECQTAGTQLMQKKVHKSEITVSPEEVDDEEKQPVVVAVPHLSVEAVDYEVVGTMVFCGTEQYRGKTDSPDQCRKWCSDNPDCQAYVTYGSGCDKCLGYTKNDCSEANQRKTTCNGPVTAYNKVQAKAISGEAACEGQGFAEPQCIAVGCCQWDVGKCWSNVGNRTCTQVSVPIAGAQSVYAFGAQGSPDCPAGYVSILDDASCQEAASSLQLTWSGDKHYQWAGERPAGCFKHVPDGKVYNNDIVDGGVATGQDKRLCKVTTPTLTCADYGGVDTQNKSTRCCPSACGDKCGAGDCNLGTNCCSDAAKGKVCGKDILPCHITSESKEESLVEEDEDAELAEQDDLSYTRRRYNR